MAEDWKDMLAKLRPADDETDGDTSDAPIPVEDKRMQKTPVKVSIDRKQRRGKTATIAEGFECDEREVAEIAASLKKSIGVGGSSRGAEILLQGDCRDRMASLLTGMGFKVKKI